MTNATANHALRPMSARDRLKVLGPLFLFAMLLRPSQAPAQVLGHFDVYPMTISFEGRLGWFEPMNARQSYQKVYGSGNVTGGVGFRFREGYTHLSFAINMDYFRKSGHFLAYRGGQWRTLGGTTELEMMPIFFTVAWDYEVSEHWAPYFGAGANLFPFRETGQDWQRANGFHVTAGTRIHTWEQWAVSAEAVYSWVPDAIGNRDLSAYYHENDLGGLHIFVKGAYRWSVP